MQRHMEETRLRGTAQQVSIFFLFFFLLFLFHDVSIFFSRLLHHVSISAVVGPLPLCSGLLFYLFLHMFFGYVCVSLGYAVWGMYVPFWGMYVSFWGMYMSFWGMYVSFFGMYVFGYVCVSLVRAIFDDAYILMPHTYLMTHTYSYSKSQLTMCQSCTC